MSQDLAIIIPSRLAAMRLPNKPLLEIADKPMILHVMERALAAGIGKVVVACGDREIAEIVTAAGGFAVMTNPAHPSGTDRVHEAWQNLGGNHKYIINLQGDLPNIDPEVIVKTYQSLKTGNCDISTAVAPITDSSELSNPNVVKAIMAYTGQALYFTRATAPTGAGDLYHHIGIYGFTAKALQEFVRLPQTPLEKRERLEQLRALENGMKIMVAVVDSIPISVDTQEDIDKARRVMGLGLAA